MYVTPDKAWDLTTLFLPGQKMSISFTGALQQH